MHINFEFKAKVESIEPFEQSLLKLQPLYKGLDHQIDTYFQVKKGRLKLREGNIENSLINYDREDIAGSKVSKIILYEHAPSEALKQILIIQLGIKAVVDKRRKIYFIDNVKFHFDVVENLGTFLEVEAIQSPEFSTIEQLKEQCDYYFRYFQLRESDLVDKSYSDLILGMVPEI